MYSCELLECIASAHYISKSPLFYRCSMALVHSRIRRVYYCYRTVCGALNTAFKLHTANGLNHHFQAFEVITDSWNLWKWYCVLSCDDVDRNFAIYCKNIYKSRNGYELLLPAGSYFVVNDMVMVYNGRWHEYILWIYGLLVLPIRLATIFSYTTIHQCIS